MTQYEKRDNSGVMFQNDRKEQPNHPDRTGIATINGVDYWVSGWIKQGNKGQFLSLAFKPKEAQPVAQQAQQPVQRRPDPISTGRQLPPRQNILPDDDMDIPF